MNKIRDYIGNPWVTAGIGLLIGLIIGLPILGWGLFPLEYKDAAARNLRQDAQVDYLRMAIDSYSINHNQSLAQLRWADLQPNAQKALDQLKNDSTVDQKALANFGTAVSAGAGGNVPVGTIQPTQAAQADKTKTPAVKATATTAPGKPTATVSNEALLKTLTAATPTAVSAAPVSASKTGSLLYIVLGVLCVLTLIVGAVLVYIFVFRNKSKGKSDAKGSALMQQEHEASLGAEKTNFAAQGQETPIAQFMSTYMLGDDLYDDSFSVDSPTGEFLGECGVGISDTIGVGDPKKVTAFEVWLFDKNDIQTVTKVLMSEHAFNDPTIRQRLASKGEPILIAPDGHIVLETATLHLEARVVDLNFGSGALPANSFFERLTLELAVWPKPQA